MSRPITLAAILVLAVGCAEWPRHANLPENTGDYPSTTDPRTLVSTTWAEREEAEPNEIPADAQDGGLSPGEGFLFVGDLATSGYDVDASPEPITDGACAGSEGIRSAGDGDYTGDVDFYVVLVESQDPATLCVRATMGDPDLGFDVVPFELDNCRIPTGAIDDPDREDRALGWGLTGGSGGWAYAVEDNKPLGILVAGFQSRTEPTAYELGFSVVPSAPDGSAGVCGYLPSEGSE